MKSVHSSGGRAIGGRGVGMLKVVLCLLFYFLVGLVMLLHGYLRKL